MKKNQEIEDLEEKYKTLKILFNLEKKAHLYDIGGINNDKRK